MLKEYDESHSEENNISDLCLTLNIKKIIKDDTTIPSHLLDLYVVLWWQSCHHSTFGLHKIRIEAKKSDPRKRSNNILNISFISS